MSNMPALQYQSEAYTTIRIKRIDYDIDRYGNVIDISILDNKNIRYTIHPELDISDVYKLLSSNKGDVIDLYLRPVPNDLNNNNVINYISLERPSQEIAVCKYCGEPLITALGGLACGNDVCSRRSVSRVYHFLYVHDIFDTVQDLRDFVAVDFPDVEISLHSVAYQLAQYSDGRYDKAASRFLELIKTARQSIASIDPRYGGWFEVISFIDSLSLPTITTEDISRAVDTVMGSDYKYALLDVLANLMQERNADPTEYYGRELRFLEDYIFLGLPDYSL